MKPMRLNSYSQCYFFEFIYLFLFEVVCGVGGEVPQCGHFDGSEALGV